MRGRFCLKKGDDLFVYNDLSGLFRLPEQKDFSAVDFSEYYKINECRGRSAKFEIFLSHSAHTPEAKRNSITLARAIENHTGQKVYIDWRDDPELDRSHVTGNTARRLKDRIIHSKMLVYADTPDARDSKWCQWELGIADGADIVPIIFPYSIGPHGSGYPKVEFLSIYPYIETTQNGLGVWRVFNPETGDELTGLSNKFSLGRAIARRGLYG